MVMETTIGIKAWLATIFPTMIPSVKEKTITEQIADVDVKIEANRQRIRAAVIRYVSMGRLAESYLNVGTPRAEDLAYDLLVGYRQILMEEYKISESDLLSAEKTKKLLMDGELFE